MMIAERAAIVTGGASGLGEAVARHLSGLGARVGLIDRNAGKGEALAEEIGAHFARADVTSDEDARQAIDLLAETNGTATILVNCAGIGTAARIVGREGPMPLENFRKVVDVNLVGTFNMMRLCAERMIAGEPDEEGQRGVIVSTASVAAFEGQIGQAAYAASKGGIAALTLPAAREFARFGVRVNAIAPGLFKTPLLGELPEEVRESLGAAIPFPNRLGKPEEFAMLVEAIIANTYLNGETVRLDGALRMQPK